MSISLSLLDPQETKVREDYPVVLFHLPRSVFDLCFSKRDIAFLKNYYRCHIPESDLSDELLEGWQQLAPTAHAVVTGWDSPRIDAGMLEKASKLQAIIHSAGSIRPFIPPSTWESGIRIATANDALGRGVAETTIGLILAGLKGFFPCAELTRSQKWQSSIPKSGYGRVRELYDVTVGIVGASRTGRHVLRLLNEFEAEVVLADPTIDQAEAAALGAKLVSLEELMEISDVISLHAPALPQLRHMLGERHFRAMKDDAIFINTARGMLVDEDALIAELKTGRITAILDVTYPEPPQTDSPLRTLSNVVLLPHIAGAITTGCKRQGKSTVDQHIQLISGDAMHGEISLERFAVMA